jgi:hypothetical protein
VTFFITSNFALKSALSNMSITTPSCFQILFGISLSILLLLISVCHCQWDKFLADSKKLDLVFFPNPFSQSELYLFVCSVFLRHILSTYSICLELTITSGWLQTVILLPQSPECWDYRYAPPYLGSWQVKTTYI